MGLKKLNLEGKILTLLEEKGGNQPWEGNSAICDNIDGPWGR